MHGATVKIIYIHYPIPVATRSKSWVCDLSLAEIAGSNPAGGMYVLSFVSVMYC